MTLLRNIVAPFAGFLIGSFVNVLLVNIGPFVIPLPEGADVSSMEGMKESMVLFQPMNFLFPFLGHALGTLVGAFVAAKVAVSYRMAFAIGIGAFFLVGGVVMVIVVGGPLWFVALDLIVAYLPMGLLGGWLGRGPRSAAHAREPEASMEPNA